MSIFLRRLVKAVVKEGTVQVVISAADKIGEAIGRNLADRIRKRIPKTETPAPVKEPASKKKK